MEELIRKQDAIDALDVLCQEHRYKIPGKVETYSQYNEAWQDALDRAEGAIGNLPSIQPNHNAEVSKMEIIRCKDCKHWNLQVGNVKGDGLGSCDFHNANLVTGEGFCYWADGRGEADEWL